MLEEGARVARLAVEGELQDPKLPAAGAIDFGDAVVDGESRGRRAAAVVEDARAKDAEAAPLEFGERARIGRGNRAHEVVDRARTFRPVDASILGAPAAEVAALGEILLDA